jgi:hypothetical protein
MSRFRFSIASLLALIVFVAVGLAALQAASDAWDGGVFSLALLTLLTSTLLAVHRMGRERAFWLGFTLFGSAYIMASLMPNVEPRLPSTRGLAYLDAKVSDRMDTVTWSSVATGGSRTGGNYPQSIAYLTTGTTVAANGPTTVRFWSTAGTPTVGSNGSTENFVRIGHSLLAFIMAIVGAHLSRFLFDRGRQRIVVEHQASPQPAPISEDILDEKQLDHTGRP